MCGHPARSDRRDETYCAILRAMAGAFSGGARKPAASSAFSKWVNMPFTSPRVAGPRIGHIIVAHRAFHRPPDTIHSRLSKHGLRQIERGKFRVQRHPANRVAQRDILIIKARAFGAETIRPLLQAAYTRPCWRTRISCRHFLRRQHRFDHIARARRGGNQKTPNPRLPRQHCQTSRWFSIKADAAPAARLSARAHIASPRAD